MKITKEEFQRSGQESPLELFYQGIKANETKEKYTRTLRQVLCKTFEDILHGTFEQRAMQLVKHAKDDPEWTRDLLLNLSRKLRERTKLDKNHSDYLNPSSIDNYFKPIKKLFDMNDVSLSWKRIYATFPELDNIPDSRGWSRKEIQKMLNFVHGTIDRVLILVSASSGIRIGGFDLNWEDMTPVYKVDEKLRLDITESETRRAQVVCAMLRIYRGTHWAYPAFITSEAYHALMDYKKEWIRDVGREPKPDEPIFKKEGMFPKRATSASIKKRIDRMIKKAELRIPLPKGQKRYDVPIMNGFRRFWNKTVKGALSRDSPLASLIKKEYMMGHIGLVKLDRSYFKTHTLELAEEYLNAVPALTISNEFRLKAENARLRKEKDEIESNKQEISNLSEQMALIQFELKAVRTSVQTRYDELSKQQ